MGLKRRDFLQRTGLALAGWGMGDVALSPLMQRCQTVLAAPTRRKLALLVGINQYATAPLSGCITDVALQQELLVHRFGFQPNDILTLTDQQATRDAIVTAFMEHLIEQANADDVVVFHFSGYGSQIAQGTTAESLQMSLVTADAEPTAGDSAIVDDLLEDTLLLLLRSLRTDKITTILDTSYTYSGGPLQGNLRIRTRPRTTLVRPSDASLAFQETLLQQSSVDHERLEVQRRSGQMPGILLTAAGSGQLATETKWTGFSAGLFTYTFTQHLWQATPAAPLRRMLRQTAEQLSQLGHDQQPQLSGQKSQQRPLVPYHLPPVPARGADGVVKAVEDEGKIVWVWLGGLPATVLDYYRVNSLLTLVDRPDVPISNTAAAAPSLLQIVARDGLMAKAKLVAASDTVSAPPTVKIGQFVREGVRLLPRNIGLTVALDSSLERIERVDAISAFSAVPRVSSAIAGEQTADYLFSKTQETQPTQVAALPVEDAISKPAIDPLHGLLSASPAKPSSYGLFSPGHDAIPNTAGDRGEAVKVAVRRLVPKLQTLLAAKLLNLTVNDGSSQLAVRATLEILDPQERPLVQQETLAATRVPLKAPAPPVAVEASGVMPLAIGSHIQYRLENGSDVPLYFLLLGVDSNGDLISLNTPLLHPVSPGKPPEPSSSASEAPSAQPSTQAAPPALDPIGSSIAPGETLTLPQASASFQWLLRGPTGLAESFLICSRAPFRQTVALLTATLRSPGDVPSLQLVANPLDVTQALLQDLHQASESVTQTSGMPDAFALDMAAWAGLRFTYQVV